MDFAFDHAHHDRAAHLRKDDAWRQGSGGGSDIRVLVVGGEHVATLGGAGLRWISLDEAPEGEWLFLGIKDGVRHAAVMVDRVPAELEPVSLRAIGPSIAPADASMAVHAVGIARWHQTHRFCARCGAASEVAQAGHVRVCPVCGAHHFPRTDPAVIMLITDDQDRALLGRQAAWPEGRFSTLAGFVEPGETLGDAVRREVMEEVGIEVGDVTYAASQPWPFPSSLMLGFFGRALSHDITVDQDEIAEARWFSREEVTELTASSELLLPPNVSISRWLLQQWHGGTVHGTWS
ncbi:NAD(+) diphosphatase [Aeromicrobium chenweiae]|uniref:NAD(+) diphosphatase n=1 Tax=Aeromicrobium chenweiae TaxID=2079793 RepID=A0A2S0WP77_9ACTN|nr:NAD(+) diphosphatase [Aeromicrobium chenweiae]AWB93149.1 NAD(+) diphosphatase [Aeromicrobium chenweiae]TGN34139.1 NAD(+) diphosphatase [Aeromicrobium chenweiae]